MGAAAGGACRYLPMSFYACLCLAVCVCLSVSSCLCLPLSHVCVHVCMCPSQTVCDPVSMCVLSATVYVNVYVYVYVCESRCVSVSVCLCMFVHIFFGLCMLSTLLFNETLTDTSVTIANLRLHIRGCVYVNM